MYQAQWMDDYDVGYQSKSLEMLLLKVLVDLEAEHTTAIRVSNDAGLALDPATLAAYANTLNVDALQWAVDPGCIFKDHIDTLITIRGKVLNGSFIEAI